jgi:tRNA (guanosine-2'-O-)-methyltransferase
MTPERFQRLKDILARRQPDLTVLMDRVHKPHNFSAILRSCDAVGIAAAHVVPAEDFAAAHDTAGGSSRYVAVVQHSSLSDALDLLRDRGMTVVAAQPGEDAADFRTLDYTRPTALLLGTELDGLSPEAVAAADRRVVVPMYGAVESLNVSVAAAVILYEAQRQRGRAGLYDDGRLADDVARRTLFEWAYPRIADLCRRRGVPYPELDGDGAILGEVPR